MSIKKVDLKKKRKAVGMDLNSLYLDLKNYNHIDFTK